MKFNNITVYFTARKRGLGQGNIFKDVCPQWRIQDFPQGGAPTSKIAIIFSNFCQKLHENERIWTPGGRPWRPLGSANGPQRGVGVGWLPSIHHWSHDWGVCIQGEGFYAGGSASSGWADLSPSRYMGYYCIQSTSRRYTSYWNAFLLPLASANQLH